MNKNRLIRTNQYNFVESLPKRHQNKYKTRLLARKITCGIVGAVAVFTSLLYKKTVNSKKEAESAFKAMERSETKLRSEYRSMYLKSLKYRS